ncbi:MAG: hypothetical protein KAS82_10120 [Bacteroidales bacterium]|nr:hypothetical protein [Bacteroidales bacterium]
MEIKYTIEILTKDIQDIEKLVGNLRNSKDDSAIELDLALSKLRNVYEILTMIKADRLHELISEKQVRKQLSAEPAAIKKPEPVPEPEPAPAAESKPEPEPVAKSEPADSSILAEKFSAESSINENLAEKRGNGIDTKLLGQPIDNISRNIGINDRFLIIRELFEGDSDQFSNLVSRLDSAENYQAATGILEKQFAEAMDHEGVEILTGLVKRRHIR